jgi:multiple sugar transport system permease protein
MLSVRSHLLESLLYNNNPCCWAGVRKGLARMTVSSEGGGVLTRALPESRLVRWLQRHHEAVEAWAILTPILIYFFAFFIFPLVADIYVSFTEWTGIMGPPRWVGLKNYRTYLTPNYLLILSNTFVLAVAILSTRTLLGFFIALLLNHKIAGRGVFRALWYAPTLTSGAIVASVVVAFIAPYDGVINAVLKAMGYPAVIWTLNGHWMRFFIVVLTVWQTVGSPVVLFLAALQGIHQEIYEAAMVDGATGWQKTRYITLPLMRPMITFVMITGMVGAFQIFATVQVMTGGGPFNMTNVVMLQIYRDAFMNARMGLAAAGSVIVGLLLMGFSVVRMRMMARQGEETA